MSMFPKHNEARALSDNERTILMRVMLKRTLYYGKPPRMMAEEETQRALRGEILEPSSLRFYVDRVALWDFDYSKG